MGEEKMMKTLADDLVYIMSKKTPIFRLRARELKISWAKLIGDSSSSS